MASKSTPSSDNLSSLESHSYDELIARIEAIVTDIERGDIPIDKLLESVKEASLYIEHCHKIITSTEREVEALVESLSQHSESANRGDSPENES